jgi:hypothetical protein
VLWVLPSSRSEATASPHGFFEAEGAVSAFFSAPGAGFSEIRTALGGPVISIAQMPAGRM